MSGVDGNFNVKDIEKQPWFMEINLEADPVPRYFGIGEICLFFNKYNLFIFFFSGLRYIDKERDNTILHLRTKGHINYFMLLIAITVGLLIWVRFGGFCWVED